MGMRTDPLLRAAELLAFGGLVYNLPPLGRESIRGVPGVVRTRIQPIGGIFRWVAGTALIGLALLWSALGLAQGAAGSFAAGQSKSAVCAACHGFDGNSITAEWPSLAGQHAAYVIKQLRAFQSGEREDVLMSSFAASLTEEDMRDLAAYYEAQVIIPGGADPALVALGERIYRGGLPDRGVAACIACHGPTGKGNPLAAYPFIQGQHATYTVNTLRAYAAGTRRSDTSVNQMMRTVAARLQEDELQAVASYVQGLR